MRVNTRKCLNILWIITKDIRNMDVVVYSYIHSGTHTWSRAPINYYFLIIILSFITNKSNLLFESRLVFVDLLARKLLELEVHIFSGRPPVELRWHRLSVFQRLVDLLPAIEHGRQFVTIGGRGTRRNRNVVHRGGQILRAYYGDNGDEKLGLSVVTVNLCRKTNRAGILRSVFRRLSIIIL